MEVGLDHVAGSNKPAGLKGSALVLVSGTTFFLSGDIFRNCMSRLMMSHHREWRTRTLTLLE